MSRYPRRFIIIISSVLIITISFCWLSLTYFPLLNYYISRYSYQQRSKVSVEFSKLNEATKVKICSHPDCAECIHKTIEDIEKVRVIQQFIKRHSEGWVQEAEWDLLLAYVATIDFYDSNNVQVARYYLGPNYLKVHYTGLKWQPVEATELKLFMDSLGITGLD